MSRQRPNVELTTAIAIAFDSSRLPLDDVDGAVLAAAEVLLRERGVHGWSIEDVARRAGVGRTTVYRRFESRDDVVHAALARELRQTLLAIGAAVRASRGSFEAQLVAGASAGLRSLDGSLVDSLLRSDPATFLPFLTTGAGPLLAIARDAIAAQLHRVTGAPMPELAEAAARLGLSFVLTRDTVLPVDDPAALADAVRRTVRPLLATFGLVAT